MVQRGKEEKEKGESFEKRGAVFMFSRTDLAAI